MKYNTSQFRLTGNQLLFEQVERFPYLLIVIFKILDDSILIGQNSKTPSLKNAECLSGGQVKWSVAEESVEDWGERQGKLRLNCDGVTEL